MGLDSVEFVISVEDAFGIEIADGDAARMRTPRDVIDHLAGRLPAAAAPDPVSPRCLTQRAFYRLRAAVSTRARVPRSAVTPGTRLRDLVPERGRKDAWKTLQADLGAARWPPYSEPGLLSRAFAHRPTDLGGVAQYLADFQPRLLRGWETPWTWPEIAAAIDRLMDAELGIRDYTLDSWFTRDLGVD